MSKHTNQPLSDNPLLNPNTNPKPILAHGNISNKQFIDSSVYGDYVSFNLDGYTATQLKELEKRLTLELEQVRCLRARIESGAFVGGPVYDTPARSSETNDVGQKRGNPFAADEQGLKNPDVENVMARMKTKCDQILGKLMKKKWSYIFGSPVDAVALGLHDYHTIVAKPMDLGTVKLNLENDVYRSPNDFASDVRLTFTNAMTYNPKDHEVYLLAEKFLGQFDDWFETTLTKFEAQLKVMGSSARPELELNQRVWNQNQLTKPIPIAKKLVEGTKKRKGKIRKPRAKDPNKRGMTTREKENLGVRLQELPPEKLGQMVQILRNRSIDVKQDGDEYEILDMDAFDIETLWELDRFVINYKQIVNKIKRQGFIQNVSTPLRNMPVVTEMGSAEKKGRKEGDVEEEEEEDVDIGEEIPIGFHPSVEIERDDTVAAAAAASGGSKTSGSSSGSSSSDSESGSSSGSGSNAPSDKIGGET